MNNKNEEKTIEIICLKKLEQKYLMTKIYWIKELLNEIFEKKKLVFTSFFTKNLEQISQIFL